jgi:hypothetical protein
MMASARVGKPRPCTAMISKIAGAPEKNAFLPASGLRTRLRGRFRLRHRNIDDMCDFCTKLYAEHGCFCIGQIPHPRSIWTIKIPWRLSEIVSTDEAGDWTIRIKHDE